MNAPSHSHPLHPLPESYPSIDPELSTPEAQVAVAIVNAVARHADQVVHRKDGNPQLKLWLPAPNDHTPNQQVVLTQSGSSRYDGNFSPDGSDVLLDYKWGRTKTAFMVFGRTISRPYRISAHDPGGETREVSEATLRHLRDAIELGTPQRPRGRAARYAGTLLSKLVKKT